MTATLTPDTDTTARGPARKRPATGGVTRPPARLALRLARRELRRRPWRTGLVVLMVLLPSAAMTLAVAMIRTSAWSAEDEMVATWGETDATAQWYDQGAASDPTPEAVATLEAALPEGSRVVVEHYFYDRVRSGDDRYYFSILDLPLDDPIVEGRLADLQGRVALTADEVVLNDDLADRMDAEIGSTIRPDLLGRELEVVGIAELQGWMDDRAYVGGPLRQASAEPFRGESTTVLVDLPGRPFADAKSPDQGFAEVGQVGTTDPNQNPAPGWMMSPIYADGNESGVGLGLFWTYVSGGVALVVLGTVITAAFAISARRQLHTVGLLSATGASPRTVKRFLVTQGAVTGALGAAIGIAIGLVVATFLPEDVVDDMVGHNVQSVAYPLVELLPIFLLGTLGAAAAASIPARSASRVSTLQALAGRRPLPRVPARMPGWGVGALIAGAACFAMAVSGSRDGGSSLWALVAIAGALSTLAGVCFISPWVVAHLDGLGARFPYSWRLAGRSLARNRVRSSAVIGAIAAVAAALVTGSTLYASAASSDCCGSDLQYSAPNHVVVTTSRVTETEPLAPVSPDGVAPLPPVAEPVWESIPIDADADLIEEVAAILPDARQIELIELTRAEGTTNPLDPYSSTLLAEVLPEEGGGESEVFANLRVGIATLGLLDEFGVPDDLRRTLDDGRAVAVGPWDADVQIVVVDDQGEDQPVDVSGVVRSPAASWSVPTLLISEATARDLGFEPIPGGVLFSNPDALTREEIQDLQTVRDDMWWNQDGEMMASETGGDRRQTTRVESDINVPDGEEVSAALIRAGVLGGVFLLMLAVVAVGLALAGKDSEDERQVLAAIGAPPRTLRRVGALRGVLLVAIAVLLAVPAGVLPAWAIVEAANNAGERLALDWPTLGFLLVVVPVATGLIVWFTSRVRDVVKPARPDTFAFGE
jgi:putative ABC transport system permease protein